MKGIQPFVAIFLGYIPTNYHQNWSTSDLVIVKTKRVNFFWNTVYIFGQTKFSVADSNNFRSLHHTYRVEIELLILMQQWCIAAAE